ncbi:uncharacterized protein LOC131875287 [Cryptomeria japonica]|uniref:uncharacterized protein LOC131875287 n=1 Tax=Cryptomeria japonica TaxID=3369 RepID=UPI0027DA4EE1|nr:uncharacterized protein LOC131875287 [Cryptomeria japonica]
MATLQMLPNIWVDIQHLSYPRHPLNLILAESLYTCSGCKKYGAGIGYRFGFMISLCTTWVYYCIPCQFYLHDLYAKGVINGL